MFDTVSFLLLSFKFERLEVINLLYHLLYNITMETESVYDCCVYVAPYSVTRVGYDCNVADQWYLNILSSFIVLFGGRSINPNIKHPPTHPPHQPLGLEFSYLLQGIVHLHSHTLGRYPFSSSLFGQRAAWQEVGGFSALIKGTSLSATERREDIIYSLLPTWWDHFTHLSYSLTCCDSSFLKWAFKENSYREICQGR